MGLLRGASGRVFVLSLVFVGGAAFVARASKPEPVPIREPLATFPMAVGTWTGQQLEPFSKEVLDVLGADEYLNRAYHRTGSAAVGLYVGYYQSQRQGDSIHSPLNCLPGAGWAPVSKSSLRLDVPVTPSPAGTAATRPIEINRYVIRKGTDSLLVLYWYQSHDRVVANEYWSKAYMIADAIRTNRTDAAMVRVIAPLAGTGADAERLAEENAVDFVKAIFPALGRHLPS